MKTIDERVETYFEGSVNYQMASEGMQCLARASLRVLLTEVARDQRLACATVLGACPQRIVDGVAHVGTSATYQAVMNAEIGK